MEKNFKKDLTLKGNSVKRLLKEYKMYVSEVEKLQSKYNEMISEGQDDYQLKKQNEYLQESISVRDNVKPKLRKMTDELISYFSDIPAEIQETEEYKTAAEIIESVKPIFLIE